MRKNKAKRTKKKKYAPPQLEKLDIDLLTKDWHVEAGMINTR